MHYSTDDEVKNMKTIKEEVKKLRAEKKLLLSYIKRSQKAVLKNTQLIAELEKQDELLSADLLPGFEDIKSLCIQTSADERKRLIKYLVRSQKAILRNSKKLRKLEDKYNSLIQPLLEV